MSDTMVNGAKIMAAECGANLLLRFKAEIKLAAFFLFPDFYVTRRSQKRSERNSSKWLRGFSPKWLCKPIFEIFFSLTTSAKNIPFMHCARA